MSLLSWFGFGKRPGRKPSGTDAAGRSRSRYRSQPRKPEKSHSLRRFEAANDAELLRMIRGVRALNDDLGHDLQRLIALASNELQNDPMVRGIVETFVGDIVGDDGPVPQITAEGDSEADKQYAKDLERIWAEWAEGDVDLQGYMGLGDYLSLGVKQLCTHGSLIAEKTSLPDRDPLSILFRINPIDPSQLQTPASSARDTKTLLGVELDALGRPLNYHFVESQWQGSTQSSVQKHRVVDALSIIHLFRIDEPKQVTGVPWTAPMLPVARRLRKYHKEVMNAVTNAARFATYLVYQEWSGADVEDADDSILDQPLDPEYINEVPAGRDVKTTSATQPTPQYEIFLREQYRLLGRCLCMPLMKVQLDAGRHNYSSARFDGQSYQKLLRRIQRWVQRRLLSKLLWEVEREAYLKGMLRTTRPNTVRVSWRWDPLPHVDPTKEARAAIDLMEAGVLSYEDVVAMFGSRTADEMIAVRKRNKQQLEEAGLPTVEETASGVKEAAESEQDDTADDETDLEDQEQEADERSLSYA